MERRGRRPRIDPLGRGFPPRLHFPGDAARSTDQPCEARPTTPERFWTRMTTAPRRYCRNCEEPLTGRADKCWCSAACRKAYRRREQRRGSDGRFHQPCRRCGADLAWPDELPPEAATCSIPSTACSIIAEDEAANPAERAEYERIRRAGEQKTLKVRAETARAERGEHAARLAATCRGCGEPAGWKGRGRPALWCSDRCRKRTVRAAVAA